MTASPLPAAAPDFRVLFEAVPGLYLVLLPDAPTFSIAAVSDSYLRATMTRREDILGQGLFEIFPDNPNDIDATGVSNLRASLRTVLETRAPHTMAVQKYDIRRPDSEGGGFEERYWAPANSPVLDEHGRVTYLLHRVEDVTEFVRLEKQRQEERRQAQERLTQSQQQATDQLLRAGGLQEANSHLRTILSERQEAEDALLRSEARFRAAVQAVSDIVWTNSPTGRMEGEQADWAAFTGQSFSEYQGYGWSKAVHPEDALPTITAWNEAVAERKPFVFEHRLRRYDGVWRLFTIRAVPVLDAGGNIREWVGVHTDITELRESEQEIAALNGRLRHAMTETHHRVRNNLQVIAALAEMQAEEGEGGVVPVSALHRVGQHVRSLAAIHDQLTHQSKETAHGADGVEAQALLHRLMPLLQATAGDRPVRAHSDAFWLPTRYAAAVSVLINELVSNALKHTEGGVEVTLTITEPRPQGEERRYSRRAVLAICDQGPGFPAGFDPDRASHTGLELVQMLARHDLQGETRFTNRVEGGACVTVIFSLHSNVM